MISTLHSVLFYLQAFNYLITFFLINCKKLQFRNVVFPHYEFYTVYVREYKNKSYNCIKIGYGLQQLLHLLYLSHLLFYEI